MPLKSFFLIFAVMCASACSTRISPDTVPILHDNEKYRTASEADREKARFDCMAEADRSVVTESPSTVIARKAAIGALVGTTTGAVSGSIFSDVDQGVASGAAVGTLVGTLQALIDVSSRTPVYERFVENCLHKQGYEVIAWRSPDQD